MDRHLYVLHVLKQVLLPFHAPGDSAQGAMPQHVMISCSPEACLPVTVHIDLLHLSSSLARLQAGLLICTQKVSVRSLGFYTALHIIMQELLHSRIPGYCRMGSQCAPDQARAMLAQCCLQLCELGGTSVLSW